MKPDEFLKYQFRTLEVVLKEDVQYDGKDYFKDVYFVPNNLTTVSISDVDLSSTFMGKRLQYPICVASLTGGDKKLTEINKTIGAFANEYQIAQGIGDQIHCVQPNVSKEVIESYSIVREQNPNGMIFANLSGKYLIKSKTYINDVRKAIETINADALEIYIEPLLNILWSRESPGTLGFLERLKKVILSTDIPVFVKTVSTGLSSEDVRQLWDAGVAGINIQGIGGTSFARIETLKRLTLSQKQAVPTVKRPFDYFGTPTVWSLLDVKLRPENKDIPLILGGGIRDGRQAVKALAFGADIISLGYPVLIKLTEDFGYPEEHNLERWFTRFIHQMKMTMCLLGARNIDELREIVRSRVVIFGKTKEWLEGRNLSFPPKNKHL